MLTAATVSPDVRVETVARAFLARLKRPARLLVAVSGGGDSLALLIALHEAFAACGSADMDLIAATVDHGLRLESSDEARHVAKICAARGIRHSTLEWRDAKPAAGLQAAARQARYRLLREAARTAGADAIVTGHTLDDQIETVTMRRRRVAGGAQRKGGGLAGMAEATLYRSDCWILRPFLAVERVALRRYLTLRGVDWIDDPSNADPRFERVRVRHAVAEESMDPGFIARNAAARGARNELLAACLAENARSWAGALFALERVNGQDRTLVLDALLEIAALAGGMAHTTGREQRATLGTFLDESKNRRINLSRCMLEKRGEHVFVWRERRNLPCRSVPPGMSIDWDGRFLIANGGNRTGTIGPAGSSPGRERAAVLAPDAPAGFAAKALANLPHKLEDGPRCLTQDGSFRVTPIVARHDTFLPAFDLRLANVTAGLVGRGSYHPSPLGPAQ